MAELEEFSELRSLSLRVSTNRVSEWDYLIISRNPSLEIASPTATNIKTYGAARATSGTIGSEETFSVPEGDEPVKYCSPSESG